MKPLESTLALINYQWWCNHAEHIIGMISKGHLHHDIASFRKGSDQAIYAAQRSKEWHLIWLASLHQHA